MSIQYGKTLMNGFARSATIFPDRPALDVDDTVYSYGELSRRAACIAVPLRNAPGTSPVVGLLAYRSIYAFSGIIGILAAGRTYMPLNPRYPARRNLGMFAATGCNVILVGPECNSALRELLAVVQIPLTVVVLDPGGAEAFSQAHPMHHFITVHDTGTALLESGPDVSPEAPAYILFTPGRDEEMNAVPITHGNISAYIKNVCDSSDFNETDRFSQEFDLTFDLSIHDMFICWEVGGCLCCIPESHLMAPARFIRNKGITAWLSIPSVVTFMSRMRLLKPGIFPSLRHSIFCGEPLTTRAAKAWQEAAPNSVIENYYGPTEATIAITGYKWSQETSLQEARGEIVPIGQPFRDQHCVIVDDHDEPVPPGITGELCLAGTQVVRGYQNKPAGAGDKFLKLGSTGNIIWYKTGDLAVQDEGGCLHWLGRKDLQTKILGYRVEMEEIEHYITQASGARMVAAIPWPVSHGTAEGAVAFVASSPDTNAARIIKHCKEFMPNYMVPREIIFLDEMPLSEAGGIDRAALGRLLSEGGLP